MQPLYRSRGYACAHVTHVLVDLFRRNVHVDLSIRVQSTARHNFTFDQTSCNQGWNAFNQYKISLFLSENDVDCVMFKEQVFCRVFEDIRLHFFILNSKNYHWFISKQLSLIWDSKSVMAFLSKSSDISIKKSIDAILISDLIFRQFLIHNSLQFHQDVNY